MGVLLFRVNKCVVFQFLLGILYLISALISISAMTDMFKSSLGPETLRSGEPLS